MVMPPKSPRFMAKSKPWYLSIVPIAILLAAITIVNILVIKGGFAVASMGGKEDCKQPPQQALGGNNHFLPADRRMLQNDEEYQPKELSVTFFCAPQPFEGPIGDNQRRALLSWLRLKPTPRVVLLGNDPTFSSLVQEFPVVISSEPDVDTSFRGLPQFHSLMARSMVASTNVSVFINADIILLENFMWGLSKMVENYDAWVLTGMRWDVEAFSYKLQLPRARGSTPEIRLAGAKFISANNKECSDQEVAEYVQSNGVLHTYGGVDFWAWNNVEGLGLHANPMPPFNFGRGRYDNWVTHEMVQSGIRTVVDGSDAVTAIHLFHNYGHVDQSKTQQARVNFWSMTKETSWESYANVHLSQNFGSNFTNQQGTAQHIPWKLMTCHDPSRANLCLLRRKRPGVCQCEHSPFVLKAQNDPHLINGTRIWKCGVVSVDKKYLIPALPSQTSPPGLPHTLESLLPQVADADKVVVLTGATYSYRALLMNFVCSLKRVGISSVLVAAFDEQMYSFAFTQGLAVYYEASNSTVPSVAPEECTYGTPCFVAITKMKTKAAFQVLHQGYSVVWTDVDVAWLRNPLPALRAIKKDTLAVQSNEPNASSPANLSGRINSGFYFARHSAAVVSAFADIVGEGANSTLPEQAIFYDVLCGGKNGTLRRGNDECAYKGVTIKFLDRRLYPNGRVGQIWDSGNATAQCDVNQCLVLHNNWISGANAKRVRFVAHDLWRWDETQRMCIHKWHSSVRGAPGNAAAV